MKYKILEKNIKLLKIKFFILKKKLKGIKILLFNI